MSAMPAEAIDRAVRIFPSRDKHPLESIKRLVTMWSHWRRSDRYPDLGYPPISAEQVEPAGPRSLPEWVIETTLDQLIMIDTPCYLRKAVLAVYAVPIKSSEAESAGVMCGKLRYAIGINKYTWPTDMDLAAAAIGVSKREMYRLNERALYRLEGKLS